jgi:hypothetical protein
MKAQKLLGWQNQNNPGLEFNISKAENARNKTKYISSPRG